MITGFYRPTTGRVVFNGHDITGLPPHKVCRAGIARTFQNIRLFGNETVLENVMMQISGVKPMTAPTPSMTPETISDRA